jgi:hypothetical protein
MISFFKKYIYNSIINKNQNMFFIWWISTLYTDKYKVNRLIIKLSIKHDNEKVFHFMYKKYKNSHHYRIYKLFIYIINCNKDKYFDLLLNKLPNHKEANEIFNCINYFMIEKIFVNHDLDKLKKIFNSDFFIPSLHDKADNFSDIYHIFSILKESDISQDCLKFIINHPKTSHGEIRHIIIDCVFNNENEEENIKLYKKYITQLREKNKESENVFKFYLFDLIKKDFPILFKMVVNDIAIYRDDLEHKEFIVSKCFDKKLLNFIPSLFQDNDMCKIIRKEHPEYYNDKVLKNKINNF